MTLCDWSSEGVLAIKYVSDEAIRSQKEHKSLETKNGYWQQLRYQSNLSDNGQYLAILFDRYCVIRGQRNNFSIDLCKISLPVAFWEYTQFRYIKWSQNNELLAITSYNNDVIIYGYNFEQIDAFNYKQNTKGNISGIIWRKYKRENIENKNIYWLELIILYDNGQLHRKSFGINNENKQVIDREKEVREVTIQYPHRKITKWIYDGIDYFENGENHNLSFMAISCLPIKLLDTKPRQTRLGHGTMLLRFDGEQIIVIKHYNSTIPSNSWFKVDSVCFTMADRRAKLYGRDINISPDGKHILCLDLRGNMELFKYDNNINNNNINTNNINELELIAKIGNTREMSYGSYRSDSRIYCMKWWDSQSIIIVFCNNTFCITPIQAISYYNQRDMKWSLNYLGPQREQLYGLPIITNTVKIENKDDDDHKNNNNDNNELRMFFILEISEAYLRRKDDEHLKYIDHPTNDIDRQQNDIYGWRKYRSMALSQFTSITSLQLFKKYLNDNKYDKALQIANMFKLNSDKAYQSQFNHLINQYNQRNNNSNNGNSNNNNNNNDNNTTQQSANQKLYDSKIATEWIEILQKINDELWIIDTILTLSLSNFDILDRLLNYGCQMIEHSQNLRDQRPHAFATFLKYRERVATLNHIMQSSTDFDISVFVENDNNLMEDYDDDKNLKYNNYLLFRDGNITDIAYQLACNDSLDALITIFKYHWHEIDKLNRLKILSWIPATTHPNLYIDILPSIKQPIWSTDRWFAQQYGLSTNDDLEDDDDELSIEQIENWYKTRIYEIDQVTGNVENSLILCNYAVNTKEIKSLQPLLETLLLFHKIIYEYNGNQQISIKQFETMDAQSRLLFVLTNSNYKSIVNDIEIRSQYFVSERDLSLVLLNICPKFAEIGKIDLVAAIINAHQQFDLLSVIKTYLASPKNIFQDDEIDINVDNNAESKEEIKNDDNDDWDEFEDNFSDSETAKTEETQTNGVKHHNEEYDKMNESDLLIEFGLLCALKCKKNSKNDNDKDDGDDDDDTMKIWNGMDKLLNSINNIKKESENTNTNIISNVFSSNYEMPQQISQFTAFIKGGGQLLKSYSIDRSLMFYYTLYNIGHINTNHSIFRKLIINEIDVRRIVSQVTKWKIILNVSNHQLQHYDALYLLITNPKPSINHDDICNALHNLAVDITTELFRGIQQKV